jgi:hypothetical protein
MHLIDQINPLLTFSTTEISLPSPGYFCALAFFVVLFFITRINNCVFSNYFHSWQSPASGYHQSNRPKAIKSHGHTKPRVANSIQPGDTNNIYPRNKDQPSLNVNNIRQLDLVPSEPDKAPHPMMAPEQIWR